MFVFTMLLATAKKLEINYFSAKCNFQALKRLKMEIVYIGDRNPNNRALLISEDEWKRLGKILSKKMDAKDALVESKRLKEMRRETSKKLVDGWNNTELVSL